MTMHDDDRSGSGSHSGERDSQSGRHDSHDSGSSHIPGREEPTRGERPVRRSRHASPYGFYPVDTDDNVDIQALIRTVWRGRIYIYKTVGMFLILGLFIALGSGEEFTSEVKLLPEAQQQARLGGLGGLARQFGVTGTSQQEGPAGIPPDLYPEIAQSLVLMQRLMYYDVALPESGERVSLYEYMTEHRGSSAVQVVRRYTIQLPFTILSGIRGLFGERDPSEPVLAGVDRELADEEKLARIVRMTDSEWEVVRELRGRVSAHMGAESAALTVSIRLPDPEMAADVADQTVQYLSEYITNYRTEKAQNDVEFIEQRYEEAEERFQTAQERLARFRDENRGELTSLARTQEQRLQSEYDLAFNLYNAMAERLEEARIKLQEDTPVVNVLEPAAVPNRRSEPRRSMILVISLMMGGLAGIGLIFGKKFWENVDLDGP